MKNFFKSKPKRTPDAPAASSSPGKLDSIPDDEPMPSEEELERLVQEFMVRLLRNPSSLRARACARNAQSPPPEKARTASAGATSCGQAPCATKVADGQSLRCYVRAASALPYTRLRTPLTRPSPPALSRTPQRGHGE